MWSFAISTQAQNGPTCTTYTNKTTADGLVQNYTGKVYVAGSTIYVTSTVGLNISSNGGASFSSRTTADGLGDNWVSDVYAVGSTVYAATDYGLSISTDGGTNFTNIATGMGSSNLLSVYADGNTIYVGTFGGLSISTNGGNSFVTRTTADGLSADEVYDIYAVGSTLYVATSSGLDISTDGGGTFTNRTLANGLGGSSVLAVYVDGSTVYAATSNGLSISTDGGASFTNYHINGTSNDIVYDVYAIGNTVYVATPNAGLGISTNGGTSFTIYNSGNGLGSNFVNGVFATNTAIYAATDEGFSLCSAMLPIELLSFTGINTGQDNLLTWKTASERNNKGFEIERSTDGINFEKIGYVAGAGNSNEIKQYTFRDLYSNEGISYYRFKQTDNEGSFEYSKIVAVAKDAVDGVRVFPNPGRGIFTIVSMHAPLSAHFNLLNSLGQTIPASVQGNGQLDLSAYPPGVYYLHERGHGTVTMLIKE